ncbi:hypothetical protein CYFUS_000782 [Cystobacter fuscus]|uniref:Uncharacterized protein n=1 Tax=Cystobacter fuscus TaxID=43 RepID=A0A250IUE6_9BACT|nr:hypothetical protein [Cystobacter fuscus]ATB35369.1 hypothetical protein CYFUS_000782 [Cystobacter fuscus]
MVNDPMEKLHQREREQERRRLREQEAKDLEVETRHGPRPLEGFAGGHTTWASQQDDRAAAQEYELNPDERAPFGMEEQSPQVPAPDDESP